MADDHLRATYNDIHTVRLLAQGTFGKIDRFESFPHLQIIGNASKRIGAEFKPNLMVAIGTFADL